MMAVQTSLKRKPPKYFVNVSTGSDSNNGLTRTTAFASIGYVNSVPPAAGDIISVATGTYPVSGSAIYTDVNGTAAAPITYISEIPYGAHITNNGNGSNPNLALWENRANYMNIYSFEIDGSPGTGNWTYLIYQAGAFVNIRGNKMHDLLTNLTAWTAAPYGALVMVDSYYGGGNNSNVLSNFFYNSGTTGQVSGVKGHGCYIAASTDLVQNNVFYNCIGQAVTSYHAMDTMSVINNTMYNVGNVAIDLASSTSTGANCVVSNNIVHTAEYGIYEESTTGASNVYNNNCIFNCTNANHHQNGTVDTAQITTDPTFVSTSTPDFHLQSGSGCKNTGTASNAPSVDIAGTRRGTTPSRGAYE